MRKSPSSSRRLVRVMSRIAEERAFRGRTPQTSRPKTISGTIVDWSEEDDDGAGGAAEFDGFDFTPDFVDDGTRSYNVQVTGGGYQTVVVPVYAQNTLLAGVDWAEALKDSTSSDSAILPKPPKIKAEDKDLIDILFPPTRAA